MRLRDRLPNYLTPAEITGWEQSPTILIFKDGANYKARRETDGAIISTSTEFSTVCQAAGDSITGNGIIFIKDPGSNISITAAITVTNKEIFITSDMATLDFSTLNGVAFTFTDSVSWGDRTCGISNFILVGDETKANQIFVKFSDMIARVYNCNTEWGHNIRAGVQLYGRCFDSRIWNCDFHATLPIELLGYVDVSHRESNGTVIENCDLGYLDGDYAIKLTYGESVHIHSCWIEAMKTGIYARNAPRLEITDNYISTTVLCIDSTSQFGLIYNNYLTNVADNGGIIKVEQAKAGVISGNILYNGDCDNVHYLTLATTAILTICGNTFYGELTATGCAGIFTDTTCSKIAITGNVFMSQNANNGIAIQSSQLDYSTITGNCFRNWNTTITLTASTATVIAHNSGHVNENWGTSTGTGAEQAINHGLVATPTLVLLSDIEIGAAPYQSAAAAADHIHVTAIINQDWAWYVRC